MSSLWARRYGWDVPSAGSWVRYDPEMDPTAESVTPAAATSPEASPDPSAGTVPSPVTSAEQGDARSGLADFLGCQSQGGFALMAVAASAPMVTACLTDAWGPERVLEDAEVRAAATADGSGPARLITVVQLREVPWTVVFKALSDVGFEHVLALSDRAADLSRSLDVEAIVFSAETLDGDAGYELWQHGERVERALWTVGQGIHRFESRLRDEPPGPPDLDLPDQLFTERGIHVPACRPFDREDGSWLEVARPDVADVARVDLLDLAGRSALPEDRIRTAVEAAKTADGDSHPSIFRSVLDLMGKVFH
jgi:hypothetical protein